MRMRHKKRGAERIAALSHLLIDNPEAIMADLSASFGAHRPLHLEIGCGKGAFATRLAAANPGINLIAVERIPDVACIALERAEAEKEARPADNLRFIIANAQSVCQWLPAASIECIYLNFSDPWPKKAHAKRRLTHAGFLKIYRRILTVGGRLEIKTDNTALFDFSLEQFAAEGLDVLWKTRDLHSSERAAGNIMTEYERNFTAAGLPICAATIIF